MFNGIKTITTPQGNKYELHWNGTVQPYDTYDAAARVLVDKMAVDVGRDPSRPEGASNPTAESSKSEA